MASPETRLEHDTFGDVEVPNERLYGAQTERSLSHFAIGDGAMPWPLVQALVRIKRAAARVNADLGVLDRSIATAIETAAGEVLRGDHPREFPLSVYQTGSGTQTNMNVNEVLANRASELLGGPRGKERLVHPNDHVNLGQSSNDVFPAAMAIAGTESVVRHVLPRVRALRDTLDQKAQAFRGIVKIGRTHLQDATPLRLGHEISAWVSQLDHATRHLEASLPHLAELALGGTAVGTGLGAHREFGKRIAAELARDTGLDLVSAPNKFEALSAHDAMVFAHGAMKTLAVALNKIANDVRLLSSGPRAGLGELRIPENEPGSSIMPGKVNPTQCEAMTMVVARVLGNDVVVNVAGAAGHLQLNVMKPVIASSFLESARLLGDVCASFDRHCAAGLEPNEARIAENVARSLMLVTALSPHVGYDRAAAVARRAHADGTTLREAALRLGVATEAEFDAWVLPEKMAGDP
ncbi:MAG TPA: class II fumarate hydratase [Polyangiaceae bacterium]|nr:class II fumarate hydratase [Polyangiaceae bacterium]